MVHPITQAFDYLNTDVKKCQKVLFRVVSFCVINGVNLSLKHK